jgi:hypothetical protein
MLSVIIPTEGIEQTAVATLAALVPGAAAGVVREVLLVDRAGSKVIERVADVAGCRFLASEGTRAAALAAGARQARSPWLMFLHAGAVLDSGWIEETTQFIHGVSSSGRPRAGIFRYARSPYADTGLRDGLKFLARMVAGPSAEQGLLIARDHYDRLGGYRPDSRRSEARLLRQLGRSSRTMLRSRIMVA